MIKLKIRTIFKIIGAAAAAANLLFEFKIPEKKEDKLTNSKKGKVIRVSCTARSNLISLPINPGAITYIMYGVKISTIVTIKSKISSNELKTSSANFFLSFLSLVFIDV